MSTTEAPAVEYALPRSEDAAQAIASALDVDVGERVTWETGCECPDDIRSTLYDAISHGFDAPMAGWHLLPREVRHEEHVLRVRMVPVLVIYESEQEQEPQESPRRRVLTMMDEYHQEAREDTVPMEAIESGTPGSTATVHEAVERLLREGEIYESGDGEFRRTGWS